MFLSPAAQREIDKYPNRIETWSDWNATDTLQAWKPFSSSADAIAAFDDLCDRYQRQRLVGKYRLIISNEPTQLLETQQQRITKYGYCKLAGIVTGPFPILEEVRA